MLTRVVPAVYERWWRPALGRIVKGLRGPTMAGERQQMATLLQLQPGATVLDVACGPGNLTRSLSVEAGSSGLVIGIDASTSMLGRAVQDTDAANVAYVRGDAVELAFRPGSFDAVCCFAALHLFADPWAALDAMTRVLALGGRLAVFTSCLAGPKLVAQVSSVGAALTGMRAFAREELTEALAYRGLETTGHRIAGLTQFVGARRAS
jgi:ubiquinone/menaquinone biosynthesis C-methylase UbiE